MTSLLQQVIEFSHKTNENDSSSTILALLIFDLNFTDSFVLIASLPIGAFVFFSQHFHLFGGVYCL